MSFLSLHGRTFAMSRQLPKKAGKIKPVVNASRVVKMATCALLLRIQLQKTATVQSPPDDGFSSHPHRET